MQANALINIAQNPQNAILRNSKLPSINTIMNFTRVFDKAAIRIVLIAKLEASWVFAIFAIDKVMASTSVIPEIAPAR